MKTYIDTYTHTQLTNSHTHTFRVKGLPWTDKNRKFTSVFDDRPSFSAKWLPRTHENRNKSNFTSIFDDRPSFPAK